jgi:hypothetical protein
MGLICVAFVAAPLPGEIFFKTPPGLGLQLLSFWNYLWLGFTTLALRQRQMRCPRLPLQKA